MEHQLDLTQGTVHVHERGEGPVLLFVHGLLVDHTLWDEVVDRLADRHRCVAVDLPLGAHRTPMRPDADLTPPAVARLVAEVMDALDLRDVVLVGNDTGGGLCQMVVAAHPERLAGLVLVTCDAYEHFPPAVLRPAAWLGRAPAPLAHAVLRLLRFGPVMTAVVAPVNRRRSAARSRAWAAPLVADAGVRRDVLRFLADMRPAHTLAAVAGLRAFDRPALVVWGRRARLFPVADARRLAADLPQGRLELVDDTRTFISLDQPDRLAGLIGRFVAEPAPALVPAAVA